MRRTIEDPPLSAPTPALARPFAAAAIGVALWASPLAGLVHAQDDGVDRAVDSTVGAVDDVADAISGAASAAADEVRDSAAWDRIAGSWKRLSGSVRERWGELTDDEVAELEGDRDRLVGKVQQSYGITRAEAEEQVDDWAAEQ